MTHRAACMSDTWAEMQSSAEYTGCRSSCRGCSYQVTLTPSLSPRRPLRPYQARITPALKHRPLLWQPNGSRRSIKRLPRGCHWQRRDDASVDICRFRSRASDAANICHRYRQKQRAPHWRQGHPAVPACRKAIIKYPTTPQMRRYTTLWNISVIKTATTWNAYLINDTLQGSVATWFRCGGIFYYCFVTDLLLRFTYEVL